MTTTLIEQLASTLPQPEGDSASAAHHHVSPSLRREASFLHCTGQVSIDGCLLETELWAGGNGHAPASQDDYLIDARHSGVLRLAVFDGVTPFERKGPGGIDQSIWAAGIARAFVRGIGEPADLLCDAHDYLHDPSQILSRHRPGTAAAVADVGIDPDAKLEVTAASAADCSVWVRRGSEWSLLVGGDHLTDRARQAWEAWKSKRPALDHEMMSLAEAVLLDDELNRESPAVGRDTVLNPRAGSAVDVDEVVLCSDGARLDQSNLDDVAAHIDSFIRETDRGDVTVLRVVFRASQA